MALASGKVRTVKSRVSVQKVTEPVSAVLRGVLFIGVSIQIVLGMVWMCCNFSHVPQFEDSLFYMRISRTLRCDGRTGILYPLFLWVTGRNHYIVYVVQLAAAYVAAWRFLHVFRHGEKWKEIWGSFALMTMPLVMQCHMAILPCSFAASLMLLELSLLAEAIKRPEKRTLKRLAGLCLCWLALALLLPEYLWLGALPVAMSGVCLWCQWKGRGKMKCYGLLLTAAFLGMILGIHSLTQTEGAWGRVQKTPLMILTQRIAWSSILQEYDSWIELVDPYVNEETILETARYADEMDRLFFPAMEQAIAEGAMTRQQADTCYITLIETAWARHKPVIEREIMWDILAYGASPAFLQRFLSGKCYDTCSSRNYDFFLEHTPQLSGKYMDYGCWWFVAAAGLTALLQVIRSLGSSPAEKKTAAGIVFCFLTVAGAMMLWYTMRGAGMQDYKNTALTDQLWMAWSVLLFAQGTAIKPRLAENGERDI
ncbi:MAG: hypothetical protein NC121_09490 [Blautia sp.]|nr:hypothetical protein [Blautia sp.]